MPLQKQPDPLVDMATARLRQIFINIGDTWVTRLKVADSGSHDAWLAEMRYMKLEGMKLREMLSSWPTSLALLIIPKVAERLRYMIEEYAWEREVMRMARRSRHKYRHDKACMFMLETFMHPYVEVYNLRNVKLNTFQKLAIRTLSTLRNITRLYLPALRRISHSQEVEKKIHLLTMLEVFEYKFHCTSEIIKELGRHCLRLRCINIEQSKYVTDDCVEFLLNLSALEFIDLQYTGVSRYGYRRILSRLPNLENIAWSSSIDSVISRIPIESLSKIRLCLGEINIARNLTVKCPNISNLNLRSIKTDISAIRELSSLKVLALQVCNYIEVNAASIITGIGSRLEELKFYYVVEVNIFHVTTYCINLKIFELNVCTAANLEEGEVIDPMGQHFTSVEHLQLIETTRILYYMTFLIHYLNLKVFHVFRIPGFSHDFVAELMAHECFEELTTFVAEMCDDLKVNTVYLLARRCKNLSVLGNMTYWTCMTEDHISELKKYIRVNCYSLDLIIQERWYIKPYYVQYIPY